LNTKLGQIGDFYQQAVAQYHPFRLEDTTMPPYVSYFASAESVKAKWGMTIDQAKIVRDLWDMALGELQTTYKQPRASTDELTMLEATRAEFARKLNVYDMLTLITECTISEVQWSRMVDIQRILQTMRAYATGTKRPHKPIWAGIKARTGQNEVRAKEIANQFNNTYAPDELDHYLQYLTDKPDQRLTSQKPWVIPGNKEGTYTLRVYGK
jgi:hypothetical protein